MLCYAPKDNGTDIKLLDSWDIYHHVNKYIVSITIDKSMIKIGKDNHDYFKWALEAYEKELNFRATALNKWPTFMAAREWIKRMRKRL